MIAPAALLADLKAQVRLLEGDLRERSSGEAEFAAALNAEWQRARDAKRTAATYEAWLDDRVTQAAVAWALATVFVRFCEDNRLIDVPYLAGPGERLAMAVERQQDYFERHPERTDRDWILAGVEALAVSHVAAGLFDRAHNPMWTITPSHDAAKALLAFWRQRGEDAEIIHDFTDPNWDTRFLGDLYQDLSEYAKKMYALLQTPEFVEEFILDYTLEPAVDEFGLDGLRMIDPTCGSGHFLLGGFRRLLAKWEARAPGADRWELIGRVLGSVHGVDKNPFAASIARFRLLAAAMRAADVTRLADAPAFVINVAIGDSLLHGRGGPGIQAELELGLFDQHETHTYVTEDIRTYEESIDILGVGSYHVVVGNPPYINVDDPQERTNYRKAYASCSGKYALSVPFAERFFQLAIRGGSNDRHAGFVGQITSNSFMKREFGEKLVIEFFPNIDLRYVIDGSGAYIPGHGTPTVILVGRRRYPRSGSTVRTVRSVQGEPRPPADPAKGLVWTAIVNQIDHPGSASRWVAVDDLERSRFFGRHPWVLEAGGLELVENLEQQTKRRLGNISDAIGITAVTGEDDLYLMPRNGAKRRLRVEATKPLVIGDTVRDFIAWPEYDAVWVYDSALEVLSLDAMPTTAHLLEMCRAVISKRRRFGTPMLKLGLAWYEWQELYRRKLTVPASIAFAEVQTHNHFALDRDGLVFKNTAPVIKLAESATDDDFLDLLSVLNSSTACFWLKQMCHCKGSTVDSAGARQTTIPWEDFYQFNGKRLKRFPIPPPAPSPELGRELDSLAQRLSAVEPFAVCTDGIPTRERLDAARAKHEHIRGKMIALQEELDWDVYQRYGLLSITDAMDLIADPGTMPELKLGERAFEIVLAPSARDDESVAQWFNRHGSVPTTAIPQYWPETYRKVVMRRIEMIENRRDIALIERPECKRRWQSEPWDKKERVALHAWLLDRCEDRSLWYVPDGQGHEQPRAMTINRLADQLRGDRDIVSVARLLAGPDSDLAEVLADIMTDEHVPCLAQLRYKESGLRKRNQWEQVWDLQRNEDRDGDRLDIPVPPKYRSGDFLRTSYWRNRGKLDVPKERFVSYPGASPDGDNSLLLGWAGWDYREQAHALMTLIDERGSKDGWDGTRLKPLIAALAEVMPWVRQWHSEVDAEFGTSPSQEYDTYLDDRKLTYGFSSDDLRDWQPPSSGRSRRRGGQPAPPTDIADAGDEPEEPEGGEAAP